ncbi:TolC family protein [Aeromonas allosaccharophila]|uniref:TolC family protein n=1 Tax=Aeromonas allosaccharophila TaxID=656 RepID=UPI0030B95669
MSISTPAMPRGSPGRLWWQQFNDPQLDRLVMAAQQQNIPIRMASERIKAAQSYQAAVSSLKVPTVSLNAGYVNMRLSENGPLSGPAVAEFTLPPQLGGSSLSVLGRDNQAHLASASIGWQADLFGRIDALSQAASIRVEQAELLQRNLTTQLSAIPRRRGARRHHQTDHRRAATGVDAGAVAASSWLWLRAGSGQCPRRPGRDRGHAADARQCARRPSRPVGHPARRDHGADP